jgi:hypothetical protein
MERYFVNPNPTNNPGLHHEVHRESCNFNPSNGLFLGYYSYCEPALDKAKSLYNDADGCRTCCPECHTG